MLEYTAKVQGTEKLSDLLGLMQQFSDRGRNRPLTFLSQNRSNL